MEKQKEEAFRDFYLLALSHLRYDELTSVNEAIKEIQKRINYGKKIILENTKKGDKIAIEAPEHCTFEDYKKANLPLYKKHQEETAIALIKKEWEKHKLNLEFYPVLADFAIEQERKVISLESGLLKPNSKLRVAIVSAYSTLPSPASKKDKRLIYLGAYGRDLSFIKRIQANKPKLAIMSDGHATMIEHIIAPTKIDYFPYREPLGRLMHFRERMKIHELHKKEKMERRTRINKELLERRKTEISKLVNTINKIKAKKRG